MITYIDTFEIDNLLRNKDFSFYILDGNKMHTRNGLFTEIAEKLKFPDYFGKNRNAFDECLQDLDWLDSGSIKILITDFNEILKDDHPEEKNIFIACLTDADIFWKTEQTKTVDFYIRK